MAGLSYQPGYLIPGQQGLASHFSQISLSGSPLFDLPLDIFLMIWNNLPNYSRVCLILTCRSLYDTNKHVLSSVGKESRKRREQRLFLLRRLRIDFPQFPFICRRCLQLYKDHPLKSKELRYPKRIRGTEAFAQKYPPVHSCCDSDFTLALRDLRSQFYDHNHKISPIEFDGRGGRHNALHYHVKMMPECTPRYFRGRALMMPEPARHRFQELTSISIEVPISQKASNRLAKLIEVFKSVRTFNIDFCSHLWLGEDFTRGDSSVSDRFEVHARSLTEKWRHESAVAFTCKHCPVRIEFHANSSGEAKLLIRRYHDLRRMSGTQWPL